MFTQRNSVAAYSILALQLVLAAGVAMLIGYYFRVSIHDYMQFDSDAAWFFDAASAGGELVALDESILVNENSLPIMMWGWIYGAVRAIGLPMDPVWGVALNTLLVILAELLALRYAQRKFAFQGRDLAVMALLMSLNGVLMMFAGIHMRDAFLLLLAVISVIAFHPPDGDQTFGRLMRKLPLLLLLMAVSFLCRTESFVIPLIAFSVSAMFALRASRLSTRIALGLVAALVIGGLLSLDIVALIVDNYEAYQMLAAAENEGGLGLTLLYGLPFPFSTVASATLVLFVKFPFWRSMPTGSYAFYVSLGALQMLFVAPAFIALVVYWALNAVERSYTYLMGVVLMVLLVTAVTSIQVRHFAIVYPCLFLLVCARRRIIADHKRALYRLLQYSLFAGAVLVSALVELRV